MASPPAGTNYVRDSATRTPVENGLNANDIDFQFPWYGYVYDPDGSLTQVGLNLNQRVSGDEKLFTRGGLKLESGAEWTRVNPGMTNYCQWDTNTATDPGAAPPGDVDTDR